MSTAINVEQKIDGAYAALSLCGVALKRLDLNFPFCSRGFYSERGLQSFLTGACPHWAIRGGVPPLSIRGGVPPLSIRGGVPPLSIRAGRSTSFRSALIPNISHA